MEGGPFGVEWCRDWSSRGIERCLGFYGWLRLVLGRLLTMTTSVIAIAVGVVLKTCLTLGFLARACDLTLPAGQTCRVDSSSFGLRGTMICDKSKLFRLLLFLSQRLEMGL